MNISSTHDLDAAIKQGPYAWPGGYPVYFITSDGAALSHATVVAEHDIIADSIESGADDGWRVVASDVNWEDPDLYDDHTGDRIESAYAEPDDGYDLQAEIDYIDHSGAFGHDGYYVAR